MDMDFANGCPLVRPTLPHIRFLFVGSRLCSTLPSDGPSRFRPCALLVLHLHQVAQGTFTPNCRTCPTHSPALTRPAARLRGLTAAPQPSVRHPSRSTAQCDHFDAGSTRPLGFCPAPFALTGLHVHYQNPNISDEGVLDTPPPR